MQLSIVAVGHLLNPARQGGKAVKLLFAQGTGIAEALGATAEARKVSFRLQLRA